MMVDTTEMTTEVSAVKPRKRACSFPHENGTAKKQKGESVAPSSTKKKAKEAFSSPAQLPFPAPRRGSLEKEGDKLEEHPVFQLHLPDSTSVDLERLRKMSEENKQTFLLQRPFFERMLNPSERLILSMNPSVCKAFHRWIEQWYDIESVFSYRATDLSWSGKVFYKVPRMFILQGAKGCGKRTLLRTLFRSVGIPCQLADGEFLCDAGTKLVKSKSQVVSRLKQGQWDAKSSDLRARLKADVEKVSQILRNGAGDVLRTRGRKSTAGNHSFSSYRETDTAGDEMFRHEEKDGDGRTSENDGEDGAGGPLRSRAGTGAQRRKRKAQGLEDTRAAALLQASEGEFRPSFASPASKSQAQRSRPWKFTDITISSLHNIFFFQTPMGIMVRESLNTLGFGDGQVFNILMRFLSSRGANVPMAAFIEEDLTSRSSRLPLVAEVCMMPMYTVDELLVITQHHCPTEMCDKEICDNTVRFIQCKRRLKRGWCNVFELLWFVKFPLDIQQDILAQPEEILKDENLLNTTKRIYSTLLSRVLRYPNLFRSPPDCPMTFQAVRCAFNTDSVAAFSIMITNLISNVCQRAGEFGVPPGILGRIQHISRISHLVVSNGIDEQWLVGKSTGGTSMAAATANVPKSERGGTIRMAQTYEELPAHIKSLFSHNLLVMWMIRQHAEDIDSLIASQEYPKQTYLRKRIKAVDVAIEERYAPPEAMGPLLHTLESFQERLWSSVLRSEEQQKTSDPPVQSSPSQTHQEKRKEKHMPTSPSPSGERPDEKDGIEGGDNSTASALPAAHPLTRLYQQNWEFWERVTSASSYALPLRTPMPWVKGDVACNMNAQNSAMRRMVLHQTRIGRM